MAVKKILAGIPVKNQGALANPSCLELYENIPETQKWWNQIIAYAIFISRLFQLHNIMIV